MSVLPSSISSRTMAWQARVKAGSEAGSIYGGVACFGSSRGKPKSRWRCPLAFAVVSGMWYAVRYKLVGSGW